MATMNVSENDEQFLTALSQDSPAKINSRTGGTGGHPKSRLVALQTSFILQYFFKKYSRSRYSESTCKRLLALIVDFAEYWVAEEDSVHPEGYRTPRVSRHRIDRTSAHVTIHRGKLRKVEIHVIDSSAERYGSAGYYQGSFYYLNELIDGGYPVAWDPGS
jgi:hypothetical protein